MISRHNPAFAGKTKEVFSIHEGDYFLDLTLGDGGHTQEALEAGARVVSVDVDIESINRSVNFLSNKFQPLLVRDPSQKVPKDFKWLILNTNFQNILDWHQKLDLPPFKAALADLGTSQYHFAEGNRGFSFDLNGPLDMRLDQNLGVTAKDLINALGEKELIELFQLSDERFAKSIAKAIVKARLSKPINTTKDLSDLILKVKPRRLGKVHPATKVFMALRMAVNLEREALSKLLVDLPKLLVKGGILGFISFHSGEDRLVKQALKKHQSDGIIEVMTVKPIQPNENEQTTNRKIRSAKLRLATKK